MLHRVRAHMRFTRGSGLATWCRDNMAVRYQMAVHIRQGEPAAEPPVNEVVDVEDDRRVFRCDLPLMDAAHAQDAVETLAAATVLGQSEPHTDVTGAKPSWVEYHLCDHADDDRRGCRTVDRRDGPAEVAQHDEWQPNTAYEVDDHVTYEGVVYRCLQAHTSLVGWEPPNTPALWEVVEA